MIDIISISLASIITIVIAALAVKQYRHNQTLVNRITDLQNQLTILTSGAVGIDQRVINFERALLQLKEQQSSLSQTTAPQHNYDHAIRLAQKGVDMGQLIDTCNLTDEEAHLIERMHGASLAKPDNVH